MAYAYLDDLKALLGADYGPLTDRKLFTTANDTVGQELLDQAEGMFNGYVAKRYAVPLAVSGDATLAVAAKLHTLRIAQRLAWENCPPRREIPQKVLDSYKDTMGWLRDVAAGRASLPGSGEIAAATADGTSAVATGNTRVATETAMEGT